MSKFYKDILKQSRLKNLNNDYFEYKPINNNYVVPSKKVITPMFTLTKSNNNKIIDKVIDKPIDKLIDKPINKVIDKPINKVVDIPKIESVEIKQSQPRVKQLSVNVASEVKNTNVPDKITYNSNDWSYNGKAYNDKDMRNIMNPNITDKVGLEKAYSLPERLYVHNNTMYVAGTSRPSDVLDDLALPFHMTKYTNKYKETDALLSQHPEVTNIVGHSLGSAVTHELQFQHPEKNYTSNTYGVPTWSNSGDPTGSSRYRNYGDPVSVLDRGSNMNFKPSVITKFFEGLPLGLDHALLNSSLEAHSYDNFDTQQIDPNVNISIT